MTKLGVREIFENISLSVISFLEGHIGISDVEFIERQGVAEVTINKWEEDNAPFKMPDDFKAFLQISDGLSLSYKIKKNEMTQSLGQMNLNKLREIKRIREGQLRFSSMVEEDDSSDEEVYDDNEESKNTIGVFDIDSKVKNGRLALIYKDRDSKPQIWFQDLSCRWFFIANTFTDYFRLMIMHLGLPNWHYAFTQVGLDPQTLQWFRFLSPERLAIDIENRRTQEEFSRKKNVKAMQAAIQNTASRGYINEKIKVEGLKRKKRIMRLKAKNQSENAIETFMAQSCRTAKYAKTVVKKRDASASAIRTGKESISIGDKGLVTPAANIGQVSVKANNNVVSPSNNNSSQAVGQAANYQTSTNGIGSGASTSGQAASGITTDKL